MPEIIAMGELQLEFLRMTVQPKARLPAPHYHETWDETVYGLDGTRTFTLDSEAIAPEPGQSFFIKRGVVHHSEITAICRRPASAS